jgi:hypothetical protein
MTIEWVQQRQCGRQQNNEANTVSDRLLLCGPAEFNGAARVAGRPLMARLETLALQQPINQSPVCGMKYVPVVCVIAIECTARSHTNLAFT